MLNELVASIQWLSRNAGANATSITAAELSLRVDFATDYKDFLKMLNGGNGRTSRNENICFFSTIELPEINAVSAIEEFLPGWLIFASDLGGKSYLMRRADDGAVFSCFDEVFKKENLRKEGNNFTDFLKNLVRT